MNSSKRSKSWKKYHEVDNHFKCCLIAKWIRYSLRNLVVDNSIQHLKVINLLINYFLKIIEEYIIIFKINSCIVCNLYYKSRKLQVMKCFFFHCNGFNLSVNS